MSRGAQARSAHRPSRRDVVLEAGLTEFTEKGYSGASMASIARRAAMSTSSCYYHFSSKDAVLEQLTGDVGEALVALVENAVPVSGPHERVDLLAVRFLEWLGDRHSRRAKLYYVVAAGVTPAVEARRRESEAVIAEAVATRLLDSWDDGIDDVERSVVAAAIVAVLGELARGILGGTLTPADAPACASGLVARLGFQHDRR
jgi:AcrR family transcriptional regulator